MKTKQYIFLFTFCFTLLSLQAQEECDKILKKAEDILYKRTPFIDQSRLISILEPCVEKGNARAENMLGLIYLNGIGVDKDIDKAYSYIYNAAQKGYDKAQYNLGRLYKYGIGCELSFNEAINWFEKAEANNNQRAAYSLGYMYYKGYGVEQDYKKAVNWFERSTDPMAKHFLGVCCYLGYGLPANQDAAVAALQQSGTINSKTFLKHIKKKRKNKNEAKVIKVLNSKIAKDSTHINPKVLKDIKIEQNAASLTVSDIDGEWIGKLVQYDWSGKHITRILPVSISFKTTSDTLKVKTTIAEQTFEATAQFKDGYVYIEDDLTFALDKLYSNNPKEASLNYTMFTLSMQEKELEGHTYLTGLVDTFIESWMEYGEPMHFVLKKKEATQVLDLDMLDALLAQEDQFIKLYPVPFNEQLTVQYQLETADNVYVELVSLNGINKIVIQPTKLQQAGNYTYTIPVNTNLSKGLYVVRVIAGNQLHTRMIIKDNGN